MKKIDIPENQQNAPWVKSLVYLIQEQAEQIAQLKTKIQDLCDEITRLKNTPKRPKFRSAGKHTSSSDCKGSSNTADRKATPISQSDSMQKVTERIVVKPVFLPLGAVFKGYTTYSVQELILTPKEIVYQLEVWQTLAGSIIRANLPKEVQGTHFGAELRALIHGLYASGVTEPALFSFVSNMGIKISKGQIHNILMKEARNYAEQSEAILSAGLQEAPYIRVDDTGAKHGYKNGYCTHIGGQYFAYYKTTDSKSRRNFLKLLLQGQEGYVINEAFIWHLFESGVEDDILNTFERYKGKLYSKSTSLTRLLNKIGLSGKKLRRLCLEAGLIGFIQETLKFGQVLISDRAGQFTVLNHADCWIHMERPLRKLVASSPAIEQEIAHVRKTIWALYEQLKKASLSEQGKEAVYRAFEVLVTQEVISPGVRTVLNNFKKHREGLLKALDYPGLPLHNNDSERDIRAIVKFRKVSGSTKSEEGRAFRDGLMTLKQSCYRLGQNFWVFLKRWFQKDPIDLSLCIRQRYQANASLP